MSTTKNIYGMIDLPFQGGQLHYDKPGTMPRAKLDEEGNWQVKKKREDERELHNN